MRLHPRLQKGFDELHAAFHQWLAAFDSKERLNAVHQRLKSVAEIARSVGETELSARAMRLERPLAALVAGPVLSEESAMQIVATLQQLLTRDTSNKAAAAPPLVEEGSRTAPIYVVNNNPLLGEDLAMQLRYFGHQVELLRDMESAEKAVALRTPAALILDIEYREDVLARIAALSKKRRQREYPIALISTRGSFKARLSAARAGVDCYFTRPVDMASLTGRLDALIFAKEAHPYRILIVSDNGVAARHYQHVLQTAKMDAFILENPVEIFEALSKHRPELVVIDVDTPECTGLDLTRLIRQNNAYLDVPIMYLLSDNNMAHRIDAVQAGADGLMAKPVLDGDLVSAVTGRSERYRALRGLIMRDSLTGLLNHSAIKETLVRELAIGERDGTPLALAMIDIDFFKRVNDTYGHPVGDQVLRTLSRLLQQRLRRGDVVGRYGGEEFAVILPDTSAAAAMSVLDQIREAFSRIRHHADTTEFTSSFSAGVADVSKYRSPDALFRAADAALYEAKRKGRNQIELG